MIGEAGKAIGAGCARRDGGLSSGPPHSWTPFFQLFFLRWYYQAFSSLQTLQEMPDRRSKPDAASFNSAMVVCETGSCCVQALGILRKIRDSRGLGGWVHCFNFF